MSRFIIETYIISQQYTLRVVYFSHGYSPLWMKNSKGQPTIPYVVLRDMVYDCLQTEDKLNEDFFENYQRTLEDALYQKLITIGKPDGARQRSKQRSRDVGASLRAIIVEEDRKIGRTKVHYLNKNPDSAAVNYDEASGIIKVDDKLWLAGSDDNLSNHLVESIHRDGGKWKRWWQQNAFFVCTSFLMLVIVPSGMIWGMLYIKDKAEQATVAPASDPPSVLNDTIRIDSSYVSK